MVDIADDVSIHSMLTDKVYGKMDIKTAWAGDQRKPDYQLWIDFIPTQDF